MSHQNEQFCFTPEEKPFSSYERENFAFCLKAVGVFALCVNAGLWLMSGPRESLEKEGRLENAREVQSVPEDIPTPAEHETVDLHSFFVRLQSEQGFQLTKVKVVLQVENSRVLNEIQTSLQQVRDHLIFILSKQSVSAFADEQARRPLEQEIVRQLNQFLTAGKVKNVYLTETFLN